MEMLEISEIHPEESRQDIEPHLEFADDTSMEGLNENKPKRGSILKYNNSDSQSDFIADSSVSNDE